MNISNLRKEYRLKELSRHSLASNPIDQFQLWLHEAITAEIVEPTAFSLATSLPSGAPACRMVLLKYADEKGLVFFTNLQSRKARELELNPQAAALFWWRDLERQALVEGQVERVSKELCAGYFAKRPRTSQLGAWSSSAQGKILANRQELQKNFTYYDQLYKDQEIPLPPFWGGFRIVPARFEFWQGRESRLHDRFQYTQKDADWLIDRLAP